MSTRATARARSAESVPARPRSRPAPAPDARPRRPAARPVARPRPRRAARPAARLRSAKVVIPLIALLLGGIVFINVATLSLTNRTGQVIERERSLESENARLKAVFEGKDAAVRRIAQDRLGMVEPGPGEARYLDPKPAAP